MLNFEQQNGKHSFSEKRLVLVNKKLKLLNATGLKYKIYSIPPLDKFGKINQIWTGLIDETVSQFFQFLSKIERQPSQVKLDGTRDELRCEMRCECVHDYPIKFNIWLIDRWHEERKNT